jgi:hypothetical protein
MMILWVKKQGIQRTRKSQTTMVAPNLTYAKKQRINMCVLTIADRSQPKVYGNFSKEDPVENESNFYAYFLTMVIVVIAGYVLFHNKQKVKQP